MVEMNADAATGQVALARVRHHHEAVRPDRPGETTFDANWQGTAAVQPHRNDLDHADSRDDLASEFEFGGAIRRHALRAGQAPYKARSHDVVGDKAGERFAGQQHDRNCVGPGQDSQPARTSRMQRESMVGQGSPRRFQRQRRHIVWTRSRAPGDQHERASLDATAGECRRQCGLAGAVDSDRFGQRSVTGEQCSQHRRQGVGTGFRAWHDEGDTRPAQYRHAFDAHRGDAANVRRSDALPALQHGDPGSEARSIPVPDATGARTSSDPAPNGCAASNGNTASAPDGSARPLAIRHAKPEASSPDLAPAMTAGGDCRRRRHRSRRNARHSRSRMIGVGPPGCFQCQSFPSAPVRLPRSGEPHLSLMQPFVRQARPRLPKPG